MLSLVQVPSSVLDEEKAGAHDEAEDSGEDESEKILEKTDLQVGIK